MTFMDKLLNWALGDTKQKEAADLEAWVNRLHPHVKLDDEKPEDYDHDRAE